MAKLCKVCGSPNANPMAQACSINCAVTYERQKKAKTKKIKLKRELNENSRSHQLKLAQQEFNKFVRLRDADRPCISCGRFHKGKYDAGHYRSVGAASHLRFNEDNCHAQCVPCNRHKSGNAIDYRINLVKKIGLERVEALENDNQPAKLNIDEIKAIRVKYKEKCKELEQLNE